MCVGKTYADDDKDDKQQNEIVVERDFLQDFRKHFQASTFVRCSILTFCNKKKSYQSQINVNQCDASHPYHHHDHLEIIVEAVRSKTKKNLIQ